MTLLEYFLAIGALLLASGFFASSETALFSLSKVQREALQQSNSRSARSVLRLLADPRRLIVTLIVGNELVNIGSSSLAARVVTKLLPSVHESVQVVIAATAMVPLILMFSDLTPKSMALRVGEKWARAVAQPLSYVQLVTTPIRWIISGVAAVLVRIFGGRPEKQTEWLREEEFLAMVDVGSEEGELQVAEKRLIHNVFAMGDKPVGRVMTPAEEVFSLPYEMPLRRIVDAISESRYSRVPIYRQRPVEPAGAVKKAPPPVEFIGVLFAKDLVGYKYGHLEGHTIQDLLHPVLFVPRSITCDRLFREFQKRKIHIALVVNEYGRMVGLVTMEDLLEELFGEIADEKEVRA